MSNHMPFPEVDVLFAGFPCVDLSPLTPTPGSIEDPDCKSGHGYTKMEKYSKIHKPRVIVLENVRTVFQKRKVEKGQSPCFG